MALDDASASPAAGSRGGAFASIQEELAYYKTQYESVEVEMQEFQASSKELEAELERDVEESEKRERKLQEKVEELGYQVEEWKAKHKQSKIEANSAQNTLQKEITALRDSQRGLQLKLRDIEVANDDFERQARNTTSSLEDLESKYNVAIERTVMLDEEVKIGEQEREALRIENQRLRDELSDLRIEAEIVQEKLRNSEQALESHRQTKTSQLLAGETLRPRSPVSETSTSATTLSSPAASTPPQSEASTAVAQASPPSPPLSEASAPPKAVPPTPLPVRKSSVAVDAGATPRASLYQSRSIRHSRGPSIPVTAKPGAGGRPTPSIRTTGPTAKQSNRPTGGPSAGALPRSGSLYQIRGLIGKMQKLEERVHSARSKLPGPTHTPPRASPRNGSALGNHHHGPGAHATPSQAPSQVPSTVTVRSSRKRASGVSAASSMSATADSGVSRLSFGMSGAASRDCASSRPSSRASMASQTQSAGVGRPGSRSSVRTPLGHYPGTSVDGRFPRPRSSMSSHAHSQSLSVAPNASAGARDADAVSDGGGATPVARRLTLDANKSAIPTSAGFSRRQSAGRRTSGEGTGAGLGDMGPPERPALKGRRLSGVGETF